MTELIPSPVMGNRVQMPAISSAGPAPAAADVERCRRIQQAHQARDHNKLLSEIHSCSGHPLAIELAAAPGRRSIQLAGERQAPIELDELRTRSSRGGGEGQGAQQRRRVRVSPGLHQKVCQVLAEERAEYDEQYFA